MNINIQVLGSTSSGNCTLVWDSESSIMVDCGFSPRYIDRSLSALDMDVASLSGVLITHAHTDHIRGPMLKNLFKDRVPVFCHNRIGPVLTQKHQVFKEAEDQGLLRTFKNKGFKAGSFLVHGFEVPHDSPGGCFGFNIFKYLKSGLKKITVATDLGYPEDDLIENFVDSDVIIIESNHDCDMLRNSTRPGWVKDRIRDIGHLSNEQCARFLDKVIAGSVKKPQAVILAHISQQCNTNCLAQAQTRQALDKGNHDGVQVLLTHHMESNEIVTIE